MAFVYRYINSEDKIIYVGKVSLDHPSNLISRINGHRSDPWSKANADARIEYVSVQTAADADALETLLIARHHPRYNSAKTGWGNCSYNSILDELVWKPYPFGLEYEGKQLVKKAIDKTKCLRRCDFCHTAVLNTVKGYSHVEIVCPGLHYYFGLYLCEACADELKDVADSVDEVLFPLKHGMSRAQFMNSAEWISPDEYNSEEADP